MCFMSSSSPQIIQTEAKNVERRKADAQATKSSQNGQYATGLRNVRTSALGLEDNANVEKKTLLGE